MRIGARPRTDKQGREAPSCAIKTVLNVSITSRLLQARAVAVVVSQNATVRTSPEGGAAKRRKPGAAVTIAETNG
jgi:hypothetical protein